jgi:cardiolipin synthase
LKLSLSFILTIIYIIYLIFVIITILTDKKSPEKTISWILFLLAFPPVGLIIYIFFGREWKRHRLNQDFSPYIKELIFKVAKKIEESDYISLIELLANSDSSPLFIDNDVTIFKDGSEKFAALKMELEKAKHHIHLEYYIVKNDKIGNEIKDILIRKANEGIKIRFIVDRVGSIKLNRRYRKDLEMAGVDLIYYTSFLAPFLRLINTQINYRNHRKIAIIDGKVGFIGGINIGDEYLGKGKLGYWRDLHIMIRGDFVLGLQALFFDDFWNIKKINGSELNLERQYDKYFPETQKSNGIVMQLLTSGPDSEFPSIMHGFIKMISSAKKYIYIATPYFIPTESLMENLKIAAMSNVDVKILFPGKYDHFVVYNASKSYLAELIKYGVEVYFYRKDAFLHSKLMTVDGNISTVGTANMDIRSFELNYEVNAVIYNNETTKEFEKIFEEDLKDSRLISKEELEMTPKRERFIEGIARLFSWIL